MKCHHWLSVSYKLISAIDGDAITNYGMTSLLTARQTVNVFVLTHIALPSPDDTKQKIMYSLTLHGELKSVRDYFPKTYSRFRVTHWRSQERLGHFLRAGINPAPTVDMRHHISPKYPCINWLSTVLFFSTKKWQSRDGLVQGRASCPSKNNVRPIS